MNSAVEGIVEIRDNRIDDQYIPAYVLSRHRLCEGGSSLRARFSQQSTTDPALLRDAHEQDFRKPKIIAGALAMAE